MKTILKKVILIVLAAALVLPFAACGGKKPPETSGTSKNDTEGNNPGSEAPMYDIKDYAIVYTNKIGNPAVDAVASLATRLSEGTGVEFIPMTDNITKPDQKEILIGNTTRPESAEALALLTDDDSFVIKGYDDCIVINAKNDAVLICAIDYFKNLCIEKCFGFDELLYVSDPVSSVNIIDNKKSDYNIVYLNGLNNYIEDGKEVYDQDVKLSHALQETINQKTGATLPIISDAVGKDYEIHIGMTSNPLCEEFRNSLAFDEYGYKVFGNTIVILGVSAATTALAVTLFGEALNFFNKDGQFVLYDGMSVTRRTGKWNLDFPEFEGGKFGGALDSGRKSYTLLYSETTADDFEKYCDKLESEGYVLWQRNDIEKNRHATYTHETRGMIHTYYTDYSNTVRIISYRAGTYNLPTHKNPEKLEVYTKTTVTQYGMDRAGGDGGMGYIITLEDSSFIVIDGGLSNTANTSRDELYELLKHLNKRPDGKIIVRAWFLTHEHNDHYTTFSRFMQKYGKEITVEEFWNNPYTSEYAYHSKNGTITKESNYNKYKGYVNGDFTWITFHTGMVFYAGSVKFEVLYTEEDLFPTLCKNTNNASTVMKMTDTRSGNTFLWLADAYPDAGKVLTSRYDGYLKSDFVQAAHHGKINMGPTYKEVQPSVVFWSCLESEMKRYMNSPNYGEDNRYLRDTASVHITSDKTYTVYLSYKLGDELIVWEKDAKK